MLERITDYLLIDWHIQLALTSLSSHRLSDSLALYYDRTTYDHNIVENVPEDEIPDQIKVAGGIEYQLTKDGDLEFVKIPEITLSWGTITDALSWKVELHRERGPARIIITNLHKSYHRYSGHFNADSITAIWARDGKYVRESGPYKIAFKKPKVSARLVNDEVATEIKTEGFTLDWKVEGSTINADRLNILMKERPVKLKLLTTEDSVFENPTDEFRFLATV